MTPAPTEPFVPLTATASRRGDSTEYRVNVVSQPETTQSFKPLTIENASANKIPGAHTSKTCDPRVSIQREGDRVTSIRIHCGCGQVIDLACIY